MSSPLLGVHALVKKDTAEIGYAQGVRLAINADLIKEYKIGSQTPEVLDYGNRSFPFTIDRMYIDNEYANLVLNGTTFDLIVYPSGSGAYYTADDCVITSWEMTISQDGVILESVSGEAKNVTYTSS